MMKTDQLNGTFAGFGQYDVAEKLELQLPQTQIKIERKSDSRFSYYRKNSENHEIRKSIPQTKDNIRIELCPILPIHLPSKKTHDLIFLRLEESIFVEKKSTANILIQFPMEIGVYVLNSTDESKELFDCFTCEPIHSRFALYGTPENGKLCMYSKVKLLEKDDSDPYVFAKMKVNITNELDNGVFIGKLVFPVTSHNFYYGDKSSEVHVDDITCTVKHDENTDVIKINHKAYSKTKKMLKLVSYSKNSDKKQYTMDKGFD
ncbi:MAG: DUF432 domain-containing protein [Candidatus Nitrosopumilus sp. bin_6a]